MEINDLLKRISELETANDQLSAEMNYLDQLMKKIGFEEGVVSLKEAAEELNQNNINQE